MESIYKTIFCLQISLKPNNYLDVIIVRSSLCGSFVHKEIICIQSQYDQISHLYFNEKINFLICCFCISEYWSLLDVCEKQLNAFDQALSAI